MWGDKMMIQLARKLGVVKIANRVKDAVRDVDIKSLAADIIVMTYAI